jgi:hypothetical protein
MLIFLFVSLWLIRLSSSLFMFHSIDIPDLVATEAFGSARFCVPAR